MPAEWAPHERTIMGWPCREEIWGDQLPQAKHDYAATANAVAAFEPLTMVCADARDADGARAALAGEVEVVELPIDDSWLRDSGPIFVLDDEGRRAGVGDHRDLLERGDRVGHRRVFAPRLLDEVAPELRPARPRHQRALVRRPFRRHPHERER